MIGLCGEIAGHDLVLLDGFRVVLGSRLCRWLKGREAYHLDWPSLMSLMVFLLEVVGVDDARN